MTIKVIYKDIDVELKRNPVTNDITTRTNEEAVKQSVLNLLRTDFGERAFQPDVGCGLKGLLFEQMTVATENEMQNAIIECLTQFEPRVEIVELVVNGDPENKSYSIHMVYKILNINKQDSVDITVKQVR